MRQFKSRANFERVHNGLRTRGMILSSDFTSHTILAPSGNSTFDQFITGTGQFGSFPFVSDWGVKDATQTGTAGSTWWPNSRVLALIGGGNPSAVTAYQNNIITTTTGPAGTTVPCLRLDITAQAPSAGSATQSQHYMELRTCPRYRCRLVFKIRENTLTNANSVGQSNYWRMVWEQKLFPNRRIRVELRYISGVPQWHTQLDILTDANPLIEQYTAIASQAVAEGWWTLDARVDPVGGSFIVTMAPWSGGVAGTPIVVANWRNCGRFLQATPADLVNQPWTCLMQPQVYGGPNAPISSDITQIKYWHWQAPSTYSDIHRADRRN